MKMARVGPRRLTPFACWLLDIQKQGCDLWKAYMSWCHNHACVPPTARCAYTIKESLYATSRLETFISTQENAVEASDFFVGLALYLLFPSIYNTYSKIWYTIQWINSEPEASLASISPKSWKYAFPMAWFIVKSSPRLTTLLWVMSVWCADQTKQFGQTVATHSRLVKIRLFMGSNFESIS